MILNKLTRYEIKDKMKQPEKKETRGRKRIYANAAERQRAYRQRMKERGVRVVTTVVKDVRNEAELKSDIIDLSEVRKW
jgi:hypothetical protein